jgi:hypothetical protein
MWFQDNQYKMQQLPIGWVSPHATLVLTAGTIINEEVLTREIQMARDAGRDVRHRLMIHRDAVVITKEDVEAEQRITKSIGSTGEGVGAARRRKMSRGERIRRAKDIESLEPYVVARGEYFGRLHACERIMLEGTQGAGLCLHYGEYPYVTSWPVNTAQLISDAGLPPDSLHEIFGVIRTMPIRVGGHSGPMASESSFEKLGLEPEFTTVTKKERRISSEIDWHELDYAFMINHPTRLCLTFGDYLIRPEREELIDKLESRYNRPVVYVGMGKDGEYMARGVPFMEEHELKMDDVDTKTLQNRVQTVTDDVLDTLYRKREDYGARNINLMGEISILSRAVDKTFRIKNLMEKSSEPNFESVYDAWRDLAGYALMGMCMRKFGRW